MQSDQSQHQDPTLYRPQETHIRLKKYQQVESKKKEKGWNQESKLIKIKVKHD